MRKLRRGRQFIDLGIKELLLPTQDKITVRQTKNFYNSKDKIIPSILSVTEDHEVIHGEHAVRKQVPKKYHRHTGDIDILTPTPWIDAREAEMKLEQLNKGEDFYLEKGANPGTVRVKAHATKETIADFTKPSGAMPPYKKIDGHNYVTLNYIKQHNKQIVADPLSGFRHAKDQDTLNRIILTEKKRRKK